jgi:hypothetical protein
MGLKTWGITEMYWHTAPSQYCPWFQTLPRESSQLILMWFNYGMQKNKHSWSSRSWLSIMYKNSGQWWNMSKSFSGIVAHNINSSVSRTAYQTHRITHSCCSIYTQTNHHCHGHQTVDVGDLVRNCCMAFYGYHRSKCTEDMDAV